MKQILLVSLLAVITMSTFAAASSGPGEPAQSPASFEAAIRNHSTSPSYVLITVVDEGTGSARTGCTLASYLEGAIHREYGIGSGADDLNEVDRIALANQAHVFHFTRQEALENLPVGYSESELAAARTLLAPLSATEIEEIFSSLSSTDRRALKGYSRDALACALIEQGFSPRMGDRTGQVYIAPLAEHPL